MRALVTGASQGIGAATARRLAQDRWAVAVHAFRHVPEAEALVREIQARGGEAFAAQGDLADPAGVATLARAVRERWDSLDLLVNNAGRYDRASFDAVNDDALDRTLRLNLTSAFRLTRELLPLIRRSTSGRIVFVSSVLAFSGSRHGAHYAAAKAGLLGLARSLALELAPGITVNTVAPGSIDTAILAGDTPQVRANRARAIPLGRVGDAKDVAQAIAFLASPAASYITGATLHVNGGLRMD